MTLTLDLSEDAAALLREAWDDLPRATLESLAVEGYRTGRLSCSQVAELLGHPSRHEAEKFLADHGAWPGTTLEEFESDLATLDRLRVS